VIAVVKSDSDLGPSEIAMPHAARSCLALLLLAAACSPTPEAASAPAKPAATTTPAKAPALEQAKPAALEQPSTPAQAKPLEPKPPGTTKASHSLPHPPRSAP
jgi:hypothetical protein